MSKEEEDYRYGKHTYGRISNRDKVAIIHVGRFCSIASGVTAIILNDHNPRFVSTYPFRTLWGVKDALPSVVRQDKTITVGNDVWIGFNAILLEGTNIGDGAIIGSYAVVHGTIPPYSIAVGNPARVVKKRFTDDQIEQLLLIKWWDWEDEKIREYAGLLSNLNPDAFIQKWLEG